MVGGGAGTLVACQVHSLGREANRLRGAADVALQRATTGPASTLYRDLDEARRLGALADDAGRRAKAIGRAGDVWGLCAGGVLAVAVLPLLAGLLSGNWALAAGAVLLGESVVLVLVLIVRQQLARTWTLDAVRPVPGGVTIVF